MISSVSFLFVARIVANDPFAGVACGNLGGSTDVCQDGLEYFSENPTDPENSLRRCCLPNVGSTYDDCKCLPCGMTCSNTVSAQQQAYDQYKALKYSDEDAKAASETYFCGDSIFWTVEIPSDIKPIFKCCSDVTADHKCNCPKKEESGKKCYSKWSNPDLFKCDFGQNASGEWCCLDGDNGECKSSVGTTEGYTDWAGCWNATEDKCNSLASETRTVDGVTQTSGCVYDHLPTQKYCGNEVSSDAGCQDPRPNFTDNNCGLNAMSDTEWFVNRRTSTANSSADITDVSTTTTTNTSSTKDNKLGFLAMQAMHGATMYCGPHWLPKSEQAVHV